MHSACDNEHAFLLDQHRILARDFHFVACIALSAIGLGLCQPPSSAIMRSASVGPQVVGSESWTGVALPKAGSTTLQAASTLSSRTNSVGSPRSASPSRRS